MIEPGTNNLIDANTGFYTDLRWDPATDTVSNIFDAGPEDAAPSPSPSESADATVAPSGKASPAATKAASPSPSATPSESVVAAADRAGSASETNWSTHWLTRTLVFLLLGGAGVLYYIKLQKGTPGIGGTD
ncbi:hypothetical protein [Arthrobacter koreensis]|uniref:hypothetical protein n=1 Tax=Arthrobacter koreensis TaxID=199136 RepID=UPI0012659AE3|nr:hypothetical protein [Arthrobacter koreensis]